MVDNKKEDRKITIENEISKDPQKDVNILQSSFVWEYEIINFKSSVVVQTSGMTEEERIERAKDLSLMNKFLLRLHTDIGLNFHVAKKIWGHSSKNNTMRKILTIIGKYSEDKHELEEKLKETTIGKLIESNIRLRDENLSDSEDANNKVMELFYMKTYKDARTENDETRAKATLNTYFEYLSGEDLSYELVIPDQIYEGSKFKGKYKNRVKEFIQSNVRYLEIYDILFDNLYKSQYNQNLRLLKRIVFHQLNQYMSDVISRSYGSQGSEWSSLIMKEIIEVLCFNFFENLSQIEKLDLLNQSYEFSEFETYISKYLEDEIQGDLTKTYEIMKVLIDQGLEDTMYNVLCDFENSNMIKNHDDFLLFKFYLLVEIDKFSEASLLTDKIQNPEQVTYQELMIFLEASIIEKDYDSVSLSLNLVNRSLENLPLDEYTRLMSEIAITFRRHYEFQFELQMLKKIYERILLNNESVPEEIKDRIIYYLDVKKNYKQIDPYVNSPEELIKFKQIAENMSPKLLQALSLMNSFAFQEALKKYKEIYQIIQINNIQGLHSTNVETLSYVGLLQLFLSIKNEAFESYEEIFETESRHNTDLEGSILRDNTIFLLLHLIDNKEITKKLGKYFEELEFENKIDAIKLIVRYIIEFDSVDNLPSYITNLECILHLDRFIFHKELAVILREKGFSILARKALENVLENVVEEDLPHHLYADILRIIGKTYADCDNHKVAIEYYNHSLEKEINNNLTYIALSKANENLLNYDKAIEFLDKIIRLTETDKTLEKEREGWKRHKQILKELATTVFNINKIPNHRSTIKNLLLTGDFYYRELGKEIKTQTLDASSTFSSYFKAFERLLHIEILQPFHHYVTLNYSVQQINQLNHGRNAVLSGTFSNNRSLTPGQWKYIFDNSTDDFHKLLINYMNNTFDPDLSQTIKDTLNAVLTSEQTLRFDELRNKISHHDIINYKMVEDNRHTIVGWMNKIIEKIYQD